MKNCIYSINQLQVSYLLNIEWHYRITYIYIRRRRDCVSFSREMLESISEARITFDSINHTRFSLLQTMMTQFLI